MNLVKFQKAGHALYKLKIPVLPKIIEILIFLIYNSRVFSKTVIGKKTVFAYLGIGCIVHKDAIIGSGCMIGQGVTIGGRGARGGVPVIKDNVFIGAGARILGPVTIGNNVIVGPNAVVITSIPDNSICVGIPAKVIKTDIEDIKQYL